MTIRGRIAPAIPLAGLLATACALSGCAAPGLPNSQAAPVPTHAPAPPSVSGKWVFRNSYTVEVLHLRQDLHGPVSGSGTSAVTETTGKVDHSAIEVHSGHARNGRLTLMLYVSQLDWGSGLNVVENLRCTVTPRVLHCRMDLPLYTSVRNVKQDFTRSG